MFRSACFAALVFLLGISVGCQPTETEETVTAEASVVDVPRPTLATYADTVALRAYEFVGGPDAWAAVPYLGFHFGVEVDGEARPAMRHLWNRRTGAYRVEMPHGPDTTYVALFDINTHEGQTYLNGAPLDSTADAEMMEQAYRRFINDMYWLLAPFKLFDPGVTRTYVPDSSGADTDVLHLAFENVGLTPGDQYWLFIHKETGRLDEWAYRLQSGREGRFRWTVYEEHATPAGTLRLATRKPAIGGNATIVTDHITMPAEPPAGIFTDPQPRL